MPTHHRTIKAKDWEKYARDGESEEMIDMVEEDRRERERGRPQERFVTGPHGEKRPISSLSSLVRAFEVATGQRDEEYVDGRKPPPKKRVRIV